MKKFSFIQRLRNKIRIKGNLYLDISSSAKLVNCIVYSQGVNNNLVIEEGTVLRNTNLEILGDNSSIVIGKNCMIGHYNYLSAKEGRTLTIKDDCYLARNIKIMTSDGHPIYQNNQIINFSKDITLDNNILVSDNVTILKGVYIGKGSVIGINATVTKNISSNSIAAGNPAKVVKENILWKH